MKVLVIASLLLFSTCHGMWEPQESISPQRALIRGFDHRNPQYVAWALKQCPSLLQYELEKIETPLYQFATTTLCPRCQPNAAVTAEEQIEDAKNILLIVVLFNNHGADMHLSFWDKPTCKTTPLHFACINGCSSIIKALLSCGADAKRPGKDGNTPLHELAYNASLNNEDCLQQAVAALVQYGADLDAKNDSGHTALQTILRHAVDEYGLTLARILIQAGANITNSNVLETAILSAHQYPEEALSLAKTILGKGILPTEQCGNCTALELAYKVRNIALIELLKQYQ